MSVWYVLPSKRPPAEAEPIFQRWRDMGYNVMVQRDPGEHISTANIQRPYVGYAEAVNFLVKEVMATVSDAEWFVTGGDDILPDPNKRAEEIANQCAQHFTAEAILKSEAGIPAELPMPGVATFGVMQPTGDRWGESPDQHPFRPRPTKPNICTCGRGKECDQHLVGASIDRVAGSPWMGREWCRRINQGKGPLWEEYFHCGEDEELQEVAIKYGVFWQRRDLTHLHQHWSRPKPGSKRMPSEDDAPAFLKRANSGEEWGRYKEVFNRRKAAGFPGSEPL